MEDMAPPSISNEPGPHTQDATIASPESLQSIEQTIEHYHRLYSTPEIPTSPLIESQVPTQNRDTLPLIPYWPSVPAVALHPSEDDNMQVAWDFKKDQS